ncbi:hypothetical protein Lfu02_17910 [Longispora fulva]|uniref:Pentapeptide repeat protein n=1 Tax=Longispora fulva TaxID=619741 RepID=A0A8J7GWM4_9ACTN|nr:hypothetical protein [Longispora fulva]MBG6140204.1 hypothetical protein [Longispora fulva]GIG57419.1 hypothetical protein Lfu02_17910 [Longispora fulva]
METSGQGELRMPGIRVAIGIGLGIGVLLVGGLAFGSWAVAGYPALRRDPEVTAGTLFELLKLVFAVVAGVGGVVALVVAYRKQRVAEAADQRDALASGRDGVRLFNERFAKASEQLGSDKAAVRLSGVYAMAGLADDWPAGRQTCVDVLCAYIRMPYATPLDDDHPDGEDDRAAWVKQQHWARGERQVRHTVIRVIAEHLRERARVSWRGHDFDFTEAVFDGGELHRVVFAAGRVSFRGARFVAGRTTFVGSRFDGANVDFTGATVSGGKVAMNDAVFAAGRVAFPTADFSGGVLHFGKAVFDGAEVIFNGATFGAGEVNFDGAEFRSGVVRFERAVFATPLDLGAATVTGTEFHGLPAAPKK